MSLGKRLVVGITAAAADQPGAHDLWVGSTNQKRLLLAMMLRRLPDVAEVLLVAPTGGAVHPLAAWAGLRVVEPADAVEMLDLLIECDAKWLNQNGFDRLHRRGGRIIAYVPDNLMLRNMQEVVHGQTGGDIPVAQGYDAAWLHPQHRHMNQSYCAAIYSPQVRDMPQLWSPIMAERAAMELGNNPFWRPPEHGKFVLGCLDGNANVSDGFHFPLLAAEHAWRTDRSAISRLLLFNTLHLQAAAHVNEMISELDIGATPGTVSLEGRFNTMLMLGREIQMVVAHRWADQAPHLFFETLHFGWPLVHNSDLLADVGYHYATFDPIGGGAAILEAARDHAATHARQAQARRALFWQASLDNPANQRQVADLIADAFARPPAAA
ncbi:DUF2827 family protein [Novosphingobium sp. FSY-8]|uniref:DUF2827 family protein n=1 Tax=Novosphingobium ovatum TaxID=1908523 RepID=A0ABW9XEF4_9SPHN|nr:DUF2827 family protein [Novosphingobium ovatum]NBC36921.1 DUF2827 family protein [Novosphingobium ovatum]